MMQIGKTIRKYRKEKGMTQEELTKEEIASIVMEADQKLKTETYDEVFRWAQSIIESYPNCLMLIWQLAVILDAQRLIKEIPNSIDYDSYILKCYKRALESEEN